MIKLKDLLSESKWIPVVVGIITPQGVIESTLDAKGTHSSHWGLNYHYGTKWRYNPKTQIVYWPSSGHSEHTEDDMNSVENHLHKKYGYVVKNQIDIRNYTGKDSVNYINLAHGVMKESDSPKEIFGLGVVDVYGVAHFKKLSKYDTETKTHSQVGLPGAMDRFRYLNGSVEWTDTPSRDSKITVEDFLAKNKFPFTRHTGYFGDVVSENINSDMYDNPKRWDDKTKHWKNEIRNVIKTKKYKDYTLCLLNPYSSEFSRIIATDGENVIGELYFGKPAPESKNIEGAIEVRPEFRRQKLATEMYKWAEELSGMKIHPSYPHSPSASKFWNQPGIQFGPGKIHESYTDVMSDDEKNDLAMSYFSVGHEDEEGLGRCDDYQCWIWDGTKIISKVGGTHDSAFTHERSNVSFKGRYDPHTNRISIVFPNHELNKLGNRKPTIDDIPTNVYNKLISKFGKNNKFVVFEYIKKSQLKQIIKEIVNLIKEHGMRGEWWFQDGQAVFADGDVGDMNHEAYVIDALKRQLLDALGVDYSRYDQIPDLGDSHIRDEIFDNIKDELTPEELEEWQNNEFNDVIISYLKRQENKDVREVIYYIRGHDNKGKNVDPREYALIHWGWQRVKGNVIQTQTLTSKDLNNIVNGLNDAYQDLEETDPDNISDTNPTGEPTVNIEVMSTRSWYENVPISILEKKNAMALNPYRMRYE